MKTHTVLSRSLLLAATLLAASALAGAMPKLPGKYTFPQAEISPGPVVFDHKTHVDDTEPDCGACHPANFSMLEKGKAIGLATITHKAMDQGQACGACHGQKKAFSLTKCDLCHKD
jgi:c(7)-type cytochrome triheme protein